MTEVLFNPGTKQKEWAALSEEDRPNVPAGWKPTRNEPVSVVRCTVIRKNGERCKRWSLRGLTICLSHGARLPGPREHAEAVMQAARMRLLDDTEMAVDTLEALMEPGTAEGIRLKASTEILDRAGIRGGFEIDVAVEVNTNPVATLQERLGLLKERGQRRLQLESAAHEALIGEIVDETDDYEQDTLF